MRRNYFKNIFGLGASKETVGARRKIYFLVANNWGSHIMCGHQMSAQLEQMGIPTEVINIYDDPNKVKKIKSSIVVFVKETAKSHENIIRRLKKQNNTLIWNPSDGFDQVRGDPGLQLFDGMIVPNQLCKKGWSGAMSKDCIVDVIYLQWDPRLEPNHCKDYKLVYAGIITPQNMPDEYLQNVKDLNILEINTTDIKEQEKILSWLVDYNCHFSIRKEDSEHFKYKPNAKVSIASATGSNAILSRDQSTIELLDERYPYLTSSRLEDVMEKVNYSRDTYGTKVWQEGLEMMKEVKDRTSIERVCNDFLDYLKQFS